MFEQGMFDTGYVSQWYFGEHTSAVIVPVDYSGRGGFDRGVGGIGTSYGVAYPEDPLAGG